MKAGEDHGPKAPQGGEDDVHHHDPAHALNLRETVAGIETMILMIEETTDVEIATGSQKENSLDHQLVQKPPQFTLDQPRGPQHHTVTRRKNLCQVAVHQEVLNLR